MSRAVAWILGTAGLAIVSLALAVLFFAPPALAGPSCGSGSCTYYDKSNNPSPGKCGASGSQCNCTATAGSQQQTGCDIPPS